MRLLDVCLIGAHARPGGPPVRLGVPLLEEYLRFLSGRCRPNTVFGRGLRPEGVLRRGWQGTSTRAAGRRVGVRDRATGRAGLDRWGAAAGRRRRGLECRCARCGAGCRACPGCTRSCMPAVTCRPTQCRAGCRPAANDNDHIRASRWFAGSARCRGSSRRPRSTLWPVRCARIGIGRWWWRWWRAKDQP
jgi:hypothetical protein